MSEKDLSVWERLGGETNGEGDAESTLAKLVELGSPQREIMQQQGESIFAALDQRAMRKKP